MGAETVKVQKDFEVKEILKKDLKDYRAMGWKEVISYQAPKQFIKI